MRGNIGGGCTFSCSLLSVYLPYPSACAAGVLICYDLETEIFMDYSPELDHALKTLRQITGLTMDVKADTLEEEEQALRQIQCLCSAYQEKYNKTHFLQGLITGTIASYDILERAPRLHITKDEKRVLFLLKTRGTLDEAVPEILKNLFPARTKSYLVPLTECSIVILRPMKSCETEEDIVKIAHTIVDTLNMEALASVQVAFSSGFDTLAECSAAYKSAYLALKVGNLFYSEQTVFPYNRLGVGRLIYQLPVSLCEGFLHEVFGDEIPDALDEETNSTVTRFLQNNLNIAETSRQLHMHRNTLIYRLEQVEKQTGLDLRNFEDAMTFKIASMVMNYLQTERNS